MAEKCCATVAQAACFYKHILLTRRNSKSFDWQIKHEAFMLDSAENENVIRWTENWMKAKERTGKMG